jgi:signal transduction histidine kinase
LLLSSLVFYLLAERKVKLRTQEELADRLKFETLLAEVSATLANPGTFGIDSAIHECLRKVGSFFGGGITSIWQWNKVSSQLERTYAWSAIPEVSLHEVPAGYLSKIVPRLMAGEDVYFGTGQFTQSDESLGNSGVKAYLVIPIRGDSQFLGALSLSNHETQMAWPADFVSRLYVIAEILGNVLVRKVAAEALMDSKSLTESILDSLQSSVAVVDKEGLILGVNKHWMALLNDRSIQLLAVCAPQSNFLDEWIRSGGGEETIETLDGIRSVLSGVQPLFEREYSYETQSERRWFRMTVTQLLRARSGAVITYLDITSQKLTELEQSRVREEAAQMNRAQEVGQLAASLTHELAQPLAAVLSNAQAAARLMAASDANVLEEVQEILEDIIKDDKRACAVLDNVRGILKKHTIRLHPVDLNEIVKDVALIVRTDALLNGVQFHTVLSTDAVFVQGDEVPLQQVLLNLVNNAMVAMRPMPSERKILTVKTQVQNGFGFLLVEDAGPGIPDTLKDKLFLPFFTTKSEGLGMGLAICASILESFGGSISFANLPAGGVAFGAKLQLA